MKRIICFGLFLFILYAFPVFAQIRISAQDVTVTKNDGQFVSYDWKLAVESVEDLSDCTLFISFRNAQGKQIHLAAEPVFLTEGSNNIDGEGVCKYDIWKLIKEYKAQISCK
ncbi:hypothetical protein ACFL9T_08415 [Thermodesulfobacteriota bacterium]